MPDGKLSDFVSLREIRLVLEICQKYLAPAHPSAAIMIEHAVKALRETEGATSNFNHKATNSSIHIKTSN